MTSGALLERCSTKIRAFEKLDVSRVASGNQVKPLLEAGYREIRERYQVK